MENRFYQLCKENDWSGTIEANIPLLSRNAMGIRFTIRYGSASARMEVTSEEIELGGEQAYLRIFEELRYRLNEVVTTTNREKTLCSSCVKRDVECSCDCAREYRKRDC